MLKNSFIKKITIDILLKKVIYLSRTIETNNGHSEPFFYLYVKYLLNNFFLNFLF